MNAPLRAVLEAHLEEGCTGWTRGTRSRWWALTLDCGHVEERSARYAPGSFRGGPYRPRGYDDVLPAPQRARCYLCRERDGG